MPRRRIVQRPHRFVSVGDLRTRVTVLQGSTMPTLGGGIKRLLMPVFTAFMAEQSLSFGPHGFEGVNVDESTTHKFTMRYRADIDAQMILERGGDRFEILEIENWEGRNQYLVLRCRELGRNDKEATKA